MADSEDFGSATADLKDDYNEDDSTGKIDIGSLAEAVYALLKHELRIERERRLGR